MGKEDMVEMRKEYRKRWEAHLKGAVNGSAEALAEWNKEGEELEAEKKRIEDIEDQQA